VFDLRLSAFICGNYSGWNPRELKFNLALEITYWVFIRGAPERVGPRTGRPERGEKEKQSVFHPWLISAKVAEFREFGDTLLRLSPK
jgi:hypothetical protein